MIHDAIDPFSPLPEDVLDAVEDEAWQQDMLLLGRECSFPYLGKYYEEMDPVIMDDILLQRDEDFCLETFQEMFGAEETEDVSSLAKRAEFLIRLNEHLCECERCRILAASGERRSQLISDGWQRVTRDFKRKGLL